MVGFGRKLKGKVLELICLTWYQMRKLDNLKFYKILELVYLT